MPLRPILQAVRNPNSAYLSGAASEMGDPLEQAAYLRGRMKAQEFIQKKQTTEVNQNRLLANQDENERRNAARETMAEQRFTQTQKTDAAREMMAEQRFTQSQKTDAARMAQQDEIQAQNLAHQQFLEKFNMQKALTDQEHFNTTEARHTANDKKEADLKQAEVDRKLAKQRTAGLVRQAVINSGIPITKDEGLGIENLIQTAEDPTAAIQSVNEFLKEKAAYSKAEKKQQEYDKAMSQMDMSKTGKFIWDTAKGESMFHLLDPIVYVNANKDPTGPVQLMRIKSSLAKQNGYQIVTASEGLIKANDNPIPRPELSEAPSLGSGLFSGDPSPVVPQSGTGPMASAAAAVPPPYDPMPANTPGDRRRDAAAVAPVAAPAGTSPMAQPSVVLRDKKTGRLASFDPETKKFIAWVSL